MRFGIIGTGTVGRTLATRLVAVGHEVTLGSRTKNNPAAASWADQAGPHGHAGTFAEAAGFGEVIVNATAGTVSLHALRLAGAENLDGKVLIDVSNPLVFSAAGEVTLDPANTDSVGELNLPDQGHLPSNIAALPDANSQDCTLIGVFPQIPDGYALNNEPCICIPYAGERPIFMR